MASLPMILGLLEDLDNLGLSDASPMYGGNFALGLQPQQIHRPVVHRVPSQTSIRVPLAVALAAGRLGKGGAGILDGVVSNVGKDGFQVCMEVQQFKPNELSVKVVEGSVVVEGKHEEREDSHGYISRHFVRRYELPKGYDADMIISTLSSDGVLTVSIPKPKSEDKPNERIIHIQQTGPAHLNVKENEEDKSEKESAANGDQ